MIDEQGKVVERMNEVRSSSVARVQAVQKEKEALEEPKNEAMEFHRKTNQLLQNRATLTQVGACIA